MIFGSGLPRAIFRKRMPRAGDHPPSGGGKALDRSMADASAGAGKKERTSRLVGCRHLTDSWVEPRLDPRRRHRSAREGDAVMQTKRPLLPKLDLLRSDAVADPEWRPRHGADGEFRGEARDRFLERQPAFQRGRL